MCDKNTKESLRDKTIDQHKTAACAIRNNSELPSVASINDIDVENAKDWVDSNEK
ncbi:MAG TPA: DUF3787 domain-containing protein [Desulfosporosinus sp.]|jgi:hypothetical protein|nr:DUF3787 domain-containing protein [Desulfosporosinus sp.]